MAIKDIEEIKRLKPFSASQLAEAYLSKKGFPLPLSSEIYDYLKSLPEINQKKKKSEAESYFKGIFIQYVDKAFTGMEARINEKTLNELKKNYDTRTINKILEALLDFEPFIKGDGVMKIVNFKTKEFSENSIKECKNAIGAANYLLKTTLSDSQKKAVEQIKEDKEFYISIEKRCKVIVDPVKEHLLNMAATPAILNPEPEKWKKEFYKQHIEGAVFVKPNGKPKKIFRNALVSIIHELLKQKDRQKKWVDDLTAEIVNQCFSLNLTVKDIDNILHGSS
jgi:hypothetical protein